MKTVFYSSLVLTAVSLSAILFQINCQDEVQAQAQIYQPIKNRFLYVYQKEDGGVEYWTASDDGTNYIKLPIELPEFLQIGTDGVFSSNGKRLIVSATDDLQQTNIYSISIEGTDLIKLVDGTGKTSSSSYFSVAQAY